MSTNKRPPFIPMTIDFPAERVSTLGPGYDPSQFQVGAQV